MPAQLLPSECFCNAAVSLNSKDTTNTRVCDVSFVSLMTCVCVDVLRRRGRNCKGRGLHGTDQSDDSPSSPLCSYWFRSVCVSCRFCFGFLAAKLAANVNAGEFRLVCPQHCAHHQISHKVQLQLKTPLFTVSPPHTGANVLVFTCEVLAS